MSNQSTLQFSVDSLLLGEIGERLVTRNYIALAELVKNAYDADATEVTIEFIIPEGNTSDQKSEIKIVDNGSGMNFKRIERFWMRIATPHKIEQNISERFGRIKTGSKGIGRFACARLAKTLILESTGKREDETRYDHSNVVFNWDEYVPGTTLTEIPNKYSSKILKKANTGTVLRLVDLRDSWTERDFNVMRRQILGLSIVSPEKREGYEEDPGFIIRLNAPSFEMGIGKLSEQVMNAGWGRLTGSVSEDGIAKLRLEAMRIGTVEFVFSEKYTEIPYVHFDIAIIQRIKEYCRDESTLALYSIDEIFENWSGIKVFLDGFRVYPFGDPKDDWLGIDERQARRLGKIDSAFKRVSDNLRGVDESRALLNQPRNQNLLGKVYLSNKPKTIFRVPINRERFIENTAVRRLKEFLRKAITWATIYYNHFLYLRKTEQMEKIAEEFEDITELKESTVEEVPRVLDKAIIVLNEAYKDYKEKVPSAERTVPGKHFDKALDIVKETTLHMNKQVTALRTIASTGALMLVFSHEAHDVVSRLGTISNELELLTKYVTKEGKGRLVELSDLMRKTRNRFSTQIQMFSGISSNLADMKKRKIALRKVSDEVLSSYSGLLEKFTIDVENNIPKTLRTGHMFEAEVYSILLNLISNSTKAVIAGYGKKIKLEAEKTNKEILLRVYDDGIGFSKESMDLVLKAGATDPENRLYPVLSKRLGFEEILSVGEGSGLGLNIIQEILRGYNKHLRVIYDLPETWKACMEVALPL